MATLVFDIDGTLLDDNGDLSENLVGFFADYTKSHRIFLATGKSLAETRRFARIAKIQDAVLICNGGASAYDMKTSKMIFSNFIGSSDKRYICHLAAAKSMAIVAFTDGGSFAYSFGDRLKQAIKETFVPSPHFFDEYYSFARKVENEDVYNLWLMVNYLHKDHKKAVAAVGAAVNKRGSVYGLITRNENLIVFNKDSSKLACLRVVFAKYGVDISNAVYFGDGIIDADCIKHVGWGVAVGNAEESVKKAANEVILPISQDGVYKWLVENRDFWSAAKLVTPKSLAPEKGKGDASSK